MDTTLLLIGASVLVSGLTQLLKHFFTSVSPLAVAAGISVAGGLVYASLLQAGYWEIVRDFSLVAFSGAVTVYQIVKQVKE